MQALPPPPSPPPVQEPRQENPLPPFTIPTPRKNPWPLAAGLLILSILPIAAIIHFRGPHSKAKKIVTAIIKAPLREPIKKVSVPKKKVLPPKRTEVARKTKPVKIIIKQKVSRRDMEKLFRRDVRNLNIPPKRNLDKLAQKIKEEAEDLRKSRKK